MNTPDLTLPNDSRTDAVVLLHGLFAGRRSMRKAVSSLQDRFRVINWGYASWWRTVENLGGELLPVLRHLAHDDSVRSINFVTHSFGAIIVRYALQLERIRKLGRAVMMAPPNSGSPLAKYSFGAFARIFPAIGQITESADSLPNRLKPVQGMDVGIIAAEDDFVVKVTNTQLENQRDHCVLPTSHFQLPHHDEAIAKSKSFLLTGRFN